MVINEHRDDYGRYERDQREDKHPEEAIRLSYLREVSLCLRFDRDVSVISIGGQLLI